jgi:hypothetical protein
VEASRALAEAYEAYPASWRRKRRSADIDIWAASATLDWLSALKPHSVDILDIGCGAVWLTDALSRYGAITGIDGVHLDRPASVRALARGDYADDPALLPRYHTTGAAGRFRAILPSRRRGLDRWRLVCLESADAPWLQQHL